MIIFWNNLTVQRAVDGQAAALDDVGVDHGGGDIFVAQQFLDGPNIITGFKEVGGKRVTQGVAANPFGDAGGKGSGPDRFLQAGFIHVVAAH